MVRSLKTLKAKDHLQIASDYKKLHATGLLSGRSPDEATDQLRTYCRHRVNLLDNAADIIF